MNTRLNTRLNSDLVRERQDYAARQDRMVAADGCGSGFRSLARSAEPAHQETPEPVQEAQAGLSSGGSRMLVLNRKKNEQIIINDEITVTVVEIRGDKARLGVEAPASVPVHRREVWDAIQRQKEEVSGQEKG